MAALAIEPAVGEPVAMELVAAAGATTQGAVAAVDLQSCWHCGRFVGIRPEMTGVACIAVEEDMPAVQLIGSYAGDLVD